MCVRMMGFVLLFALAANAEAVTRLEEIPFEKLQAQCCLKKSSPIVPGFSIEKGEKGRYVFQDCSSFYSGDFLSFENSLKKDISGDTSLDDVLKLCLKDNLENAWSVALIVSGDGDMPQITSDLGIRISVWKCVEDKMVRLQVVNGKGDKTAQESPAEGDSGLSLSSAPSSSGVDPENTPLKRDGVWRFNNLREK